MAGQAQVSPVITERCNSRITRIYTGFADRGAPRLSARPLKSELGSIEALFVNAGISPLTPLESTAEDVYDELFAINVKGAFFTVQELAPLLSANAGVVLTTSIANVIGMVDTSVYAAGKAALRSMARTFSRELLPRGIRVNAISPGPIDSGILETMNLSKEAADQFRAERTASNPMKRYGTVEEFATLMTTGTTVAPAQSRTSSASSK